jgi:methylated-DNA-[protein]-cysteine S-methyltransferase
VTGSPAPRSIARSIAWSILPVPAPIRELTIGTSDAGVVYVGFGDGLRWLTAAARRVGADLIGDRDRTRVVCREVTEYLGGDRTAFTVPVDWSLTSGTQRTVLMSLHETVGYGTTATYGELAVRSGAYGAELGAHAARGVGSIMGSNPIPLVVPCHRVVAADGLGGFGGGLEVKRWLLELEGALPATLAFDLA